MSRALIALQLAVALAACGSTPATPADAAVDAAADAVAADGPQADAAPWGSTGARVIHSRQVRPWFPCGDFGPCPAWFPEPMVLRARSVAGGIELRVGVVESVSDGGVAAGFADQLTPTAVFAEVGEAYDTPSGPRRPFVTEGPALWTVNLLQDQPALPIRNATFRGSLDAADVPTSNDPAMGGTVEGCFASADAEQIYITLLAENLNEVLQSSGSSVDVDCTGSGSLDGYAFEAQFEAEAVALQ